MRRPQSLAHCPLPHRPLRITDELAWRSLGRWLLIGYVFTCVAVALISYGLKARDDYRFRRLQQAGVVAQGHIVNRTFGGRSDPYITYRFTATTSNGEHHVFTASSRVSDTAIFQASSDVNIIYDPIDPTISGIQGDLHIPQSILDRIFPFCLFGMFPLLIGAILVVRARTQIPLARTFEQHGVITEGTVVDQWYQQGKGGGNAIAFTFLVPLPDGSSRTFYGAELTNTFSAYQRLKVGTQVHVRYLPDNPSVCRLEE